MTSILSLSHLISCSKDNLHETQSEKEVQASTQEEKHGFELKAMSRCTHTALTACTMSILRIDTKMNTSKKYTSIDRVELGRKKLKKLSRHASYISNQQLHKPSKLPVSEFPVTFNEKVNFWIKYFTHKGKKPI